MPLYSLGLWDAVILVAESKARAGQQLAKYIIGDGARPTSVTESPDSRRPLM